MVNLNDLTKKQLYMTIGISGSGKSYYRRDDCILVSKDMLRKMFLYYEKTGRNYYIDAVYEKGRETLEELVGLVIKSIFNLCLVRNFNIYLDETNLMPEKRKWYIEKAISFQYDIHFLVFDNLLIAEKYNVRRRTKIRPAVIENQKKAFTMLNNYEKSIAKSIKIIKEEY